MKQRPIISETETLCSKSSLHSRMNSARKHLATGEVRDVAESPPRFVRLTKTQQLRAAVPVLERARRLCVLDGEEPLQAIAVAGNCGIECEYARQVMRHVLWVPDLISWQMHPLTTRGAITKAFDRALKYARKALPHKGGWGTSSEVAR